MGMYERMYREGEVRETVFANILLFCSTWPMFLGGRFDKRTECEVKDRQSYEESDRKSLSERGVPEYMVVVEDTAGVWLVHGYECYTHCKSLVEKGEMPPAWGVYNLRYTGKLSWELKVGVGLHTGVKSTIARDHELSLMKLLRGVCHLYSGRKSGRSVGEDVALLKEVFEDNGMEVAPRMVGHIAETGRKLCSVMSEFVELYGEGLDEQMGIGGSPVFADYWWQQTFTWQYIQDWWYKEGPIVQVLLAFMVVDCEKNRNLCLEKQENLRLTIILILRECATLISIVSKGRWGFLFKRETASGRALQRRDTMFHMVGFAITRIISNCLDDLVTELGEELNLMQDQSDWDLGPMDEVYLPTGAKLREDVFEATKERCMSKVLEVLHEHGYLRTRNMIKDAELA